MISQTRLTWYLYVSVHITLAANTVCIGQESIVCIGNEATVVKCILPGGLAGKCVRGVCVFVLTCACVLLPTCVRLSLCTCMRVGCMCVCVKPEEEKRSYDISGGGPYEPLSLLLGGPLSTLRITAFTSVFSLSVQRFGCARLPA